MFDLDPRIGQFPRPERVVPEVREHAELFLEDEKTVGAPKPFLQVADLRVSMLPVRQIPRPNSTAGLKGVKKRFHKIRASCWHLLCSVQVSCWEAVGQSRVTALVQRRREEQLGVQDCRFCGSADNGFTQGLNERSKLAGRRTRP